MIKVNIVSVVASAPSSEASSKATMAPDPSAEELLPHSSQGTSEGIVEMNKNEKKLYALKQAGIVAGKAADPRPDAGDATSVSISADRHTTSTKNNNNRTRIAGHFWVSNARLLCLIMALDLMTMSVQVEGSR